MKNNKNKKKKQKKYEMKIKIRGHSKKKIIMIQQEKHTCQALGSLTDVCLRPKKSKQ